MHMICFGLTLILVVGASVADSSEYQVGSDVVSDTNDISLLQASLDLQQATNMLKKDEGCSYDRDYVDHQRCVWESINHYKTYPNEDGTVPQEIKDDCNNDSNCAYVYQGGGNMYTCSNSEVKGYTSSGYEMTSNGYEFPAYPRWTKTCAYNVDDSTRTKKKKCRSYSTQLSEKAGSSDNCKQLCVEYALANIDKFGKDEFYCNYKTDGNANCRIATTSECNAKKNDKWNVFLFHGQR